MSIPRLRFVTVVALMAVTGCGGDGTGPESVVREDLIRTFTAELYRSSNVNGSGPPHDALADGTTITLSLHSDGTTSGRFAGSGFSLDLAGTFAFDAAAAQVTFQHSADTSLREMVFDAVRAGDVLRLEAEKIFNEETLLRVTLVG